MSGRARASSSRWAILGAFGLLVAATQVLWLAFAPITAEAHHALGVSKGAVGDLAVINPLMYVILAIPAGRWMDRRFGAALTTGALLTAVGALVRTLDTSSYGLIFLGQFLISAGQPFVLNATTKIAARYFPPTERTTAIAVGTAAQFIGILAAATSGQALQNAGGLRLVLVCHAIFALVAATAVVATLRVPPAYPAEATGHVSLGWLRRDILMWRLGGLLFIGVGVFNAVATWLDTILGDLGHPNDGGALIAVMTVAGILGAAALPTAAGRANRRREVLLAATVATTVLFLAIALVHGVVFVTVALAVEGFVLLAGLPVALDWSELEVGPARAGTATGFLLLAGNLGGVILVLAVQTVLGNPHLALIAMAALAVPGIFLALPLPRSVRRHGEPTATVATEGLA